MLMTTDSSPAEAFEALRREVALLRRALEGLAAEQKAQPDYSGILAGVGERIKEQNATLGTMAEAPALQLTPEAMGRKILCASERVRAEDARLLGLAQNGMTNAARQIEASLATARTAHEQQKVVRWYAAAGALIGALLMLIASLITPVLKAQIQEVAVTNAP
jgi:choline dehydrogenase-like flavoprotein